MIKPIYAPPAAPPANESVLARSLLALEQAAREHATPQYARLRHGLTLRITHVSGLAYTLAIARKEPQRPSTVEEATCLAALAPVFAGEWQRHKGRGVLDGVRYQVSAIQYHR